MPAQYSDSDIKSPSDNQKNRSTRILRSESYKEEPRDFGNVKSHLYKSNEYGSPVYSYRWERYFLNNRANKANEPL